MGAPLATSVVTGSQRGPVVAWASALALLVVYALTVAPDVTLWDAGEFLAAAHSLGVPHPPGTPLFILVAHVWGGLLSPLPFALAVNAASAVATAAACALLGWAIVRWTGERLAGFLGAIAAGTMAAVWQSATETEVYAFALLLVALTLVVADRAGAEWSDRRRLLVVYAFALAVPLHISALVAAPAIIYLTATDAGGVTSWRAMVLPAGAFLVAAGLGTVAVGVSLVGVVLVIAGSTLLPNAERAGWRVATSVLAVLALGASAVLVMYVRARLEPAVNQGGAFTWHSLVDVIGRRQYDVPGIWPRRAPLWLQVGNVVQYADWQVASSLDDWPGASLVRTPFTLLFVALAAYGSAWHRRRDRRSWRALLLLFASASLGVVLVLNLRAGPSYGWGVLPAGAIREARERDYFFALAFAIWGVWGGCGAAALAARHRAAALLAFIPLALNLRAVDRRRAPEVAYARAVGEGLLASSPRDAVLVVAGDNDTYPVWFAQEVRAIRRDVVPVTIPLLGARWYRDELRRRHGLLESSEVEEWRGEEATLRAIAAGAARKGREVAAAVSLLPSQRAALGERWRLAGLAYVRAPRGGSLSIDTSRTRRVAAGVEWAWKGKSASPRDGAARYIGALLRCPAAAVEGGDGASRALLESTCNYR